MVAVIGSGTSIRKTFLYNQNKEKEGVAQCIMAANYPMALDQLNQEQRLNMLLRTASLNPDCKRNSIHISLNFAPGEQLSDSKLGQIATRYMELIGFGQQPFLVYRHYDAGHPHIHICTTNIRPDGTRIDTFNIGKLRSEPARKTIEEQFSLVHADENHKEFHTLDPVDVARITYGKLPTKKAINNVLQSVLSSYKFTSLPELNAVLGQYNIAATRGAEGSRTYQHSGLLYHLLDADGKPVGVPIKASLFYNNPGLKFLEKQYLSNDVARQAHKQPLKNSIDLLLRSPGLTLETFIAELKNKGVHVAVRTAKDGSIYGLTYVDHRSRCVFNGSALGKDYSAKAVLDRLGTATFAQEKREEKAVQPPLAGPPLPPVYISQQQYQQPTEEGTKSIIESLLEHEYSAQHVPFEWRRRKKKKKKR